MKLNELSFYCVNCGCIFDKATIEKRKLEPNVQFKTVFECPTCLENDFQIYSNTTY